LGKILALRVQAAEVVEGFCQRTVLQFEVKLTAM
jgi:hypothetical protein